jgi:HAD superfamily hydrolase (TIGR01549 family)
MNIIYENVIFDFGGTLTSERDSIHGDRSSMQNLYGEIIQKWFKKKNYSVELSAAKLQALTVEAHSHVEGRPNQRSMRNNIEYYCKWFEYIYNAAGLKASYSHADLEASRIFLIKESIKSTIPQATREMLNTFDALQKSGIKMGILSNNNGYVEDMVDTMQMHHYFDFFVDSARIGMVKPGREIFDYTAKKYNLNTESLLYVGDDFANDVVGALNADWAAAWLSTELAPQKLDKKYYQINRLSELLPICISN